MRRIMFASLGLLLIAAPLLAAPVVVKEWKFDQDLEGWSSWNHMQDVRAADGSLQAQLTDWDPFIKSPQFEIPATPWQVVEIRLKTDDGGDGEIFWTNTTDTPYQGFSPGKETHFQVIGDNQWHDYRLYPYWQGEGKIILLRLDLPAARGGGKSFALDSIRIVDLGAQAPVAASEWNFAKDSAGVQGFTTRGEGQLTPGAKGLSFQVTGDDFQLLSPPLKLGLDDRYNVHLVMTINNAKGAGVVWAAQPKSGLQRLPFSVRADGKPHSYNLDMTASAGWTGEALLVGVSLPRGATGTLQRLAVTDRPLGPADVEVTNLIVDTALPRAGRDVPLLLSLRNNGGATASGLRIGTVTLPAGVQAVGLEQARNLPDLAAGDTVSVSLRLHAAKPVTGTVQVQLTGPGAPSEPVQCALKIGPALNLPKAAYVPVPKPVASDYEVGAFYFPGWCAGAKWDPVRRVAPQRKPVLGWYDEGNPECVDWQIKWAVEHAIKYFMVDWYWCGGNRSLEHWLKAYDQAKYRDYLKWCVMWANHNPANTSSAADERAVTKFWIDNYFKMPSYYRVNDMPVVIIWAPGNLRRDLGGSEAVKQAMATSQQMAREAGYKGIYFMAMAGEDAGAIQQLKDEGYSETTEYHYMGHGGKAADPTRFTFDLVADSSLAHWEKMKQTPLPFLPNLATGWDARPWHGENTVVITGRTVPLFRKICEDAKRFADRNGLKRLSLAPLNEWGEGSYLEPCQEFGFDMYNVVRDVFGKVSGPCKEDYGPADVGLGPYDFKDMDLPARQAWDFSDGAQGWAPAMGVRDCAVKDGALTFTTSSGDPALSVKLAGLLAADLHKLTFRMKYEGLKEGQAAQLFWSSGDAMTEGKSTSFKLIADGQWHDYVLDLDSLPRWRGKLRSLRFDPCSQAEVKVSIDSVKFE